MIDGKFLVTAIGLGVVVAAICNFTSENKIKENFWNTPSRTVRVFPEVAKSKQAAMHGDLLSTPARMSSMVPDSIENIGVVDSALSARFGNYSVGANIRQNPPSYEHMAVPSNPLTFNSMASENYVQENFSNEGYCGSCVTGPQGCEVGPKSQAFMAEPMPAPPGFAAGDYNQVLQQTQQGADEISADSLIPVGDMTTVNAAGEVTNPIVYDRLVYANRNSRTRGLGDWIRGDLAIAPCAPGWFRPSVNANIDLNQGALGVIGGYDNESARAMYELVNQASAGTDTTLGGYDALSNVNMANQLSTSTSALSDVTVTAFP